VTSASNRFSGYCSGRLPGVLWIVASATGFGAMAIFAKTAYGDGVGLEALLFLCVFHPKSATNNDRNQPPITMQSRPPIPISKAPPVTIKTRQSSGF